MTQAANALMGFLASIANWTSDNLGGRIMRPFIEKAIHALSAQGAKLSARAVIDELTKQGFDPEKIRNSSLFKYAAPTLLTAGAGALNVKVPAAVFGGDKGQAKELEGFLNNIIDRAGEGASSGILKGGVDSQTMTDVKIGEMVYSVAHNMPGLGLMRHLAVMGEGDKVSTICPAVAEFYENNALRNLVFKMGLHRLDKDAAVSEIDPNMTYHKYAEVQHLDECPHCLGKLAGDEAELTGPTDLESTLTAQEKRQWAALVQHVAAHEHRVAAQILKRGRVAILKHPGLIEVLKVALTAIEIGREEFVKDAKRKVVTHGVLGVENDPTGNQLAPTAQGVIDVLYILEEVQVDGVTEWRQLLDESVDGNWLQTQKRRMVQFVANNGAAGAGLVTFGIGLIVVVLLAVEAFALMLFALGEAGYIMSWTGPNWLFSNPLVPGTWGLIMIVAAVAIIGAQLHLLEWAVLGLRNKWPSLDRVIERLPDSMHWLKSKEGEAEGRHVLQPGLMMILTLSVILVHILMAFPVGLINLESRYLSTGIADPISRWIAFFSLVTLGFWVLSATRGALQDDKQREAEQTDRRGWSRFRAFLSDTAFSSARTFNLTCAAFYVGSILIQPVVALGGYLLAKVTGISLTAASTPAALESSFFVKLTGVPGWVHSGVFVMLVGITLVALMAAVMIRARVGKIAFGAMTALGVLMFLFYFGLVGPGLTVAKLATDVGYGDGFFGAPTYDWMYPEREDERRAERANTTAGYTTTPQKSAPPVVSNDPTQSPPITSDRLKEAREELAELGY